MGDKSNMINTKTHHNGALGENLDVRNVVLDAVLEVSTRAQDHYGRISQGRDNPLAGTLTRGRGRVVEKCDLCTRVGAPLLKLLVPNLHADRIGDEAIPHCGQRDRGNE